MTRTILLSAGLALGLSAWLSGAPGWRRLDTVHLTVAGNADEKELQSVAIEFERLRETLSKLFPPRATVPIVPTVVLVFASEKELDPFTPLSRGKPIDVSGLSVPSIDINYFAVAGGSRDLRAVFHDYVHLVTANLRLPMPVWLDEGLAEYYSTFELSRDGRRADVGHTIAAHQQRLRHDWLPLQELLPIQRDSPLYNEANRRTLLYAESWALVHFLFHGTPSRRESLVKFMNAVEDGVSEKEAWTRLFGSSIETSLRDYASRATFQMGTATLVEPVEIDALTDLSDSDVDAFLGDFLARLRRQDDAVARLEPAAARPDGARARAALARVWVRENRAEDARALLARTTLPTGDWLTDYATGVAVADTLGREKPGIAAAQPPFVRSARDAMKTLLAERPELAHGWHVLAGLALFTDTDVEPALEAAEQARFLAPARPEYAVRLAEALVRRREHVKARQMLGPLLANARAAPVADQIRSLMVQIADAERAAAEAPAAPPPKPEAPEVILDLRRLRSGEERAGGLLARIDCAKDGLTFHVRVGDDTAQFRAAKMEEIEFVSYREDLRGSVKCGAREPEDPVYLTWKMGALPKTDVPSRMVVAIEFLPKDYPLKP